MYNNKCLKIASSFEKCVKYINNASNVACRYRLIYFKQNTKTESNQMY